MYGEEGKEEELEKKLEESRKRKKVKQKGLLNMSGWLVKEIEGKGEKRWKRVVVRAVPQEGGGCVE